MSDNNALALFDPAALPAHVVAAQEAGETNIVTSGNINALTFAGKVWSLTLEGNKKPLMKRGEDGEEEPVQIFSAIILQYPERRGRAYFKGAYDPNKESAPLCWSNDGVTSDPNSTERQSESCAKCPLSVKGSKQTDTGNATTACSQHRNIAIIPASKIGDFPPLRLKLAITSDFDGQDKEAQAQGWFGFKNYLDFLKGKRVPFTYQLTTRIKFDPKANYPKLLFSPGKWLSDEQFAVVKELSTSPDIEALLKTEYTPGAGDTGPAAAPIEEEAEEDAPAPVVAKPKGKPAPAAAAPVADEGDEEVIVATKPATTVAAKPAATVAAKAPAPDPKAQAAAKAAAARKAAPQVADEGDELEAPTPAATKPKPAAKPAPAAAAPVAASAAVSAVLGDWDDE